MPLPSVNFHRRPLGFARSSLSWSLSPHQGTALARWKTSMIVTLSLPEGYLVIRTFRHNSCHDARNGFASFG